MLVSELSKQFIDITNEDINRILQKTYQEYNGKMSIFFLDASYGYTFHLDDFQNVKMFNLLGRYFANRLKKLEQVPKQFRDEKWEKRYWLAKSDNTQYCNQWHQALELWHDDRSVILGDNKIKPIQIERRLDRAVNEGMEMVARFICGEGTPSAFDCRGLGDGDGDEASVADLDLVNPIDIINVNTTPEGGSLSRDGTTIYSVGNHSKEVETPNNEEFTECAMFDSTSDDRRIFDHAFFDDPVHHVQHEDAPGSTTIIYMCSG